MADQSKIEWTEATWNPVTGCTKVSPGCDHCYAETFAERWRGKAGHHFERGFDLVLRPERLTQPLRWKRPRHIFVNSMSDLFHEGIDDDYIARVFAVMSAGHHTYQLLTKRHARMRNLLSSPGFQAAVAERRQTPYWSIPGELTWPLPNLWLGVSVEDQKWADIRIPALLATPAAVRWLSCEPLLSPIVFEDDWFAGLPSRRTWLDWVVAGGESGARARPMHPEWVRGLRDQCRSFGVPFFFKQWGESLPLIGHRESLHLEPAKANRDWDRPFGDDVTMCRVGKKNAGRLLDGRTWDEYPEVAR